MVLMVPMLFSLMDKTQKMLLLKRLNLITQFGSPGMTYCQTPKVPVRHAVVWD